MGGLEARRGIGLMVTSLLWASGCSADGFGLDEADAGTGTAGTQADDESGDPELDGTGTGEDPSDDDDSGEGAGDGGDCPADCGPNGWCELDELERPTCACNDGFAAYGLRCLECVPTEGSFEVDVPRVMVGATFQLAGERFPASIYEYGHVSLRDPQTGDLVELGQTRHGGTLEEVAMLPGSYEVVYSGAAGGSTVPANRDAVVDTVLIPDAESHDLVIDVPMTEISGSFTLSGAEPPRSIYDTGLVVLRDSATGDEIELGETRHGSYDKVVVPGTYEIHYRNLLSDGAAPINADAIVGSLVVDESEEPLSLDIDVPTTMLSGSFRLDGATPPNSIYENGELRLRDPRTASEVVLGQTREGAYEAPVVTGQYEVVYRRLLGGDEVPVNSGAVLEELAVVGELESHDIDVQTAVVTGTITVDGSPPPTDPSNDGLIVLRNTETGDEARLGNTHDGSYSRRVVRGQYDVHYRQETSSGGVPVNTNARLQAIDIQGGASFDIDVPMVTVSAAVTIDGQLPPDSAYDDGLLYLLDEQTGDSVLLGNTRLASLERPVVPATYDLVYVVEAAGPTVPVNARAKLATVDVASGPELVVDIPVTTMTGAVTLAGEDPPASIYDRAELLLHDVDTADVIPLGRIDLGVLTQTLTAGTYVVVYRDVTSSGTAPANRNAGLSCFELTAG